MAGSLQNALMWPPELTKRLSSLVCLLEAQQLMRLILLSHRYVQFAGPLRKVIQALLANFCLSSSPTSWSGDFYVLDTEMLLFIRLSIAVERRYNRDGRDLFHKQD